MIFRSRLNKNNNLFLCTKDLYMYYEPKVIVFKKFKIYKKIYDSFGNHGFVDECGVEHEVAGEWRKFFIPLPLLKPHTLKIKNANPKPYEDVQI